MDNIAVLISTCNRSEFLSCIFNYYSKNNFRHKIYVGDASDYDLHILMVNKIKSKYKNLDIQFVHFPDYNNGVVDNLKVIGILVTGKINSNSFLPSAKRLSSISLSSASVKACFEIGLLSFA